MTDPLNDWQPGRSRRRREAASLSFLDQSASDTTINDRPSLATATSSSTFSTSITTNRFHRPARSFSLGLPSTPNRPPSPDRTVESFGYDDGTTLRDFTGDEEYSRDEELEEAMQQEFEDALQQENRPIEQDLVRRRLRQRSALALATRRSGRASGPGPQFMSDDDLEDRDWDDHDFEDLHDFRDRQVDGAQSSRIQENSTERDQNLEGRGFWSLFRSRRREANRPWVRDGNFNTNNDWNVRSATPSDDSNSELTFLYSIEPAPTGSDVWPDLRDQSKLPAKLTPVDFKRTKLTKSCTKPKTTPARTTMQASESPATTPIRTPTWPMNELPVELYYLIADSLSRDDIKAMRLTCHEFESSISSVLFKTVVVPFNTEIYGMLTGTPKKVDMTGKGKGKMKTEPSAAGFWKNATAEDIYTGHGIDVFRTFGPRMKKFGMSFEVDEDALANPPLKGSREAHKSYWGEYTWPYPEYHRFEQVAGLEDAADETPRMKFAFSLLGNVQELALSLDSGLGWLAGPDLSLRSRVLRKPAAVFGTVAKIKDRKQQAQIDFWQYLKDRSALAGGCDLRHAIFHFREMTANQTEFQDMQKNFTESGVQLDMPYINLRQLIDPSVSSCRIISDEIVLPDDPFDVLSELVVPSVGMTSEEQQKDIPTIPVSSGGVLMVKEDTSDQDRFDSYPIIPNSLTKMQKEWLLETEWAQRAFLSSYLLAIVDNRHTFSNVHTINFSRLSSRYLLSLARNDFWNALPNLKSVNLQVIADWRDVIKDNAGFVETPRITLGAAQSWFYRLLFYMIVPRKNITKLNIGWACGGEHAEGLHARNKQLMPAPFLSSDWMSSPENMVNRELMAQGMIDMRYIEELTLTNCWMPPDALVALITKHENISKLVLNSVSLSAPLSLFNGNGNNAPIPVIPGIPPPNANQAGPNLNPHQQLLAMQQAQHQQFQHQLQQLNSQAAAQQAQGQQQLLAHQLQTQHVQLQAQHAQLQVQHAQHLMAMHLNPANNAGNAPIGINVNVFQHGNAPPPPAVPTQSWIGEHRVGSWPRVIDIISPGATLAVHGCTHCPPNVVISNSSSKLKTLEFRSCGYCRLNTSRFDESAIMQPSTNGGTVWLTKRYQALNKVMMKDKYNWIADIVQHIPLHEEDALKNGWDMTLGWEDANEAEGSTFDGCLPGGTGRFSGAVTIDSRAPVNEGDD
ncbi:gb [Venturia nashicola]|uniref:Gb n=1 Tax=Venturia nashicola TaxID=86259 RepID=A0A4Z1NWH0_9PEZI|nr:gb [Venturia nashicola]TLD27526.1 gb [Venturia nashicola]